MFGFGVIAPCCRRSMIRPETVGCAEPKRWSGRGRPYFSGVPTNRRIIVSKTRMRSLTGSRGSFGSWSTGRPKRYFGRIHAPRRAARNVRSATWEDSTAMSIALLPIPRISARRPAKRSLSR